jgi:hypothetical protein
MEGLQDHLPLLRECREILQQAAIPDDLRPEQRSARGQQPDLLRYLDVQGLCSRLNGRQIKLDWRCSCRVKQERDTRPDCSPSGQTARQSPAHGLAAARVL